MNKSTLYILIFFLLSFSGVFANNTSCFGINNSNPLICLNDEFHLNQETYKYNSNYLDSYYSTSIFELENYKEIIKKNKTITYCSENTHCSSWSNCLKGIKTRTCKTNDNCIFKIPPKLEKKCNPHQLAINGVSTSIITSKHKNYNSSSNKSKNTLLKNNSKPAKFFLLGSFINPSEKTEIKLIQINLLIIFILIVGIYYLKIHQIKKISKNK